MNLKRFLTIGFLTWTVMTSTISSTISASVDQEQELLKHTVSKSSLISEVMDEPFSEEEKTEIEKNYRKNLEQRLKVEEELANELASILNDDSLKTKVVSVDKQDKIDAMLIMINAIENTKLSEDIKEEIQSYINMYGPYTGNATLLNYIEQLKVKNITMYSSYNRDTAVGYAYTWWETYNSSSYPDLRYIGGDCANFVSQCLKAGGKSTDSKWYITKKNSTYSRPTSVSQLNYSWGLANPSPWISAIEFNEYWANRVSYHGSYSAPFVYQNPQTIYSAPYYLGDAVQILIKNNWWYEGYHTMIITKYEPSKNDYRLTYHSTNTKDKLLNSIALQYNSDNFRFRFFCM